MKIKPIQQAQLDYNNTHRNHFKQTSYSKDMHIDLKQKPHNPTIIVGFPGVGLIGPIVTEFLIDHMKTEQIGTFIYTELPPTAAIHKRKLVSPMSVHYSAQHNTIIVYTILNMKKVEWSVANAISEMAKELHAKEIICIDGANVISEEDAQIYVYGNEKILALGAKPLEESVVTGMSGALLLTQENVNCVFATTQTEMPDSKAAAEVVKFLDKYLNLIVDYKPLLEQAQQFEDKLKGLIKENKKISAEQDRKALEYLG